MRSGVEYFTEPSEPAQRRYEALRAYFVEELVAAEVGARFGYSPANVHQMASDLRAGRAAFFLESKPGPKGPSKSLRIRDRVLELRAQEQSVEIAQALTAAGTPVSAQTVWAILEAEGLERLERRPVMQRGAPPPRLKPVKTRAIPFWPAGESIACDHAGLFLLVPAIVELGLHELAGACGYPSTKVLSAWHSLRDAAARQVRAHGQGQPHRRARRRRRARAAARADRAAQGHAPDQLLLPRAPAGKRAAAGCRHPPAARARPGDRRAGVQPRLPRDPPPRSRHPTGEALRATPLAAHPRSADVLAQDHASTEMVYANADLTKVEQTREVIAFADYWQNVTGEDPGLLVFDSKLTTYKVLSELTERGIRWLTLRERGPKLIRELTALRDSEWKTVRVERSGRYR